VPTDDSTLGIVFAAVAVVADVDVERVAPDTKIYQELGVDSLGSVALFIELRKIFGIREPDSHEAARKPDTPRALAAYVECADGP
jgi:acyl carrier protein